MRKTIFATATALVSALGVMAPGAASAQELYLGQIIMGGWNFCPRGTLRADGQLLPISSNTALFSLLGTNFGGDGRTTFALPDLRGRSPVNNGTGPGLANVNLGQSGGVENQTLTVSQMPSHTHTATTTAEGNLFASPAPAAATEAAGNLLSNQAASTYAAGGAGTQELRDGAVTVTATTSVGNTGGSVPFNIRDPYLGITYCVVQFGIFPSRS